MFCVSRGSGHRDLLTGRGFTLIGHTIMEKVTKARSSSFSLALNRVTLVPSSKGPMTVDSMQYSVSVENPRLVRNLTTSTMGAVSLPRFYVKG